MSEFCDDFDIYSRILTRKKRRHQTLHCRRLVLMQRFGRSRKRQTCVLSTNFSTYIPRTLSRKKRRRQTFRIFVSILTQNLADPDREKHGMVHTCFEIYSWILIERRDSARHMLRKAIFWCKYLADSGREKHTASKLIF